MSLLLKALKQAGDKSAAGARNPSATLADSLSLEPISDSTSDASAYTSWDGAAPLKRSATSAAWYSPWLSGQRSLVPVVAVLAALFMLIYGAFVYWQTRTPATLAITPTAHSATPATAPSTAAPAALAAVPGQESGPALPEIKRPMPDAPAAAPLPSANADATPQWGSGELLRETLPTGRERTPVAKRETHSVQPFSMQSTTPHTDPQLEAAYQAYQAGRTHEARSLYQRIPDGERNVDVQLGLAAIALRDNDTPAAARHYQRVLELDPRNTTANSALIGMMGDADPNASETRLKSLIASQPSAQLYFALGNLYAGQERWPDAEQA